MISPPISPGILTHVGVAPLSWTRFENVLDPDGFERLRALASRAEQRLAGRVVWNVNSTAHGGGVAEMLRPLLAYVRGAGVDARWEAIAGDAAFFRVTKRLHNRLHGMPGDGLEIGAADRTHYEEVLEQNRAALSRVVRAGDIVILHDPQTAGLIPGLRADGVRVVWRCHVGLDEPNDLAREAWHFLLPYVREADAQVFSRREFFWEGLDPARLSVIAPSLDPFSPKNCEVTPSTVSAILDRARLVPNGTADAPVFRRHDGSPARVDRAARIVEEHPVPSDARLVVQVSRWDRAKDPLGVLVGFADHVAPHSDAHLVLAGPDVESVPDDPEGAEVLREVVARWEELPATVRGAIHLACLPMEDEDENAAIVNALQRRADVVVQKSLAEGFGLTVAEAMWKRRPVVAGRVGGIRDQIVQGVSGVLLDDPRVLAAFGEAVLGLLEDPTRAREMGAAAQERVRQRFLAPRHLAQYVDLLERVVGGGPGGS